MDLLRLIVSGLDSLLARLLIASAELALIVVLLHLLIVLSRIRCPRVLCFLWLAVLVKPLLSVTAGSLLAVPLFQVPPLSAHGTERRHPVSPVARSLPGAALSEPADAIAASPADAIAASPADDPYVDPARPLPAVGKAAVGAPRPPGRLLPWAVLGVWLGGAGLCLIRYLHALLRLRGIVRASVRPDPDLEAAYRRQVRSLGIYAPPPLLISDQVESPALVGIFRPTILLPRWHAEQCNADQLHWSLRHELIHWRWLDSLSIFVRDIARIVFWFHPAIWWGSRRLTESLETACDHALVHSFHQAGSYADYLFEVLRAIRDRRRIGLAGGLFATRTQIGRRIAALLDGSVTSAPGLTARSLVCMIVLSGAILAVGATIRTPARPSGLSAAAESFSLRSVEFPKNRTLGYCHVVSGEVVKDDRFAESCSMSISGEDPLPQEARGTVTVPAGAILKLQVAPDTFRVDRPFAGLRRDDVQIVSFEACPRPGGREIEALSDLSGLLGLSLCGQSGRFHSDPPLTRAAIERLAAFEHLRGLCLPSAIEPEALEALTLLPSLTALQIQGPPVFNRSGAGITEDQLAAIGRLTSLTRLTLACGHSGASAGLAHLGSLRSLRSLRLIGDVSPELNRHLRHIGSLHALESLDLSRSAVTDEGLAHLGGLTRLRRLNLEKTAIGDSGLAHLAGLHNLEELILLDTRIGDAGLKHLEGLKQLRRLSLLNTAVTDAGLASVSELAALEELWVPNRAITDEGFARLGQLKSLRRLSAPNAPELTDAGMRSLPGLPALQTFHVRGPRLTDASMPDFARCGALRELGLSASITDAGLAYLTRLQGLRELTLHNMELEGTGLGALGDLAGLDTLNLVRLTLAPGGLRNLRIPPGVQCLRLNLKSEITDDDLVVLSGLKRLKFLALHISGLTDQGLRNLAELHRLESLSIVGRNLQITDAGLKSLEHLPALQSLFLRGTRVTQQGLHEFRDKLPGLNVYSLDPFQNVVGLSR